MKKKDALQVAMFDFSHGNGNQRNANRKHFDDVRKALKERADVELFDFDNLKERHRLEKAHKQNPFHIGFVNGYGRGEGAALERFLRLLRIPYFGSSPEVTEIALDKIASKEIFKKAGLPIIPDVVVHVGMDTQKALAQVEQAVRYPCIIKDPTAADSTGIFVARDRDETQNILLELQKTQDQDILVEKFLEPVREFGVPVTDVEMGLKPLEFITQEGTFNEDAKLFNVPMQLSTVQDQTLAAQLYSLAKKAYASLGISCIARAEILMDEEKNMFLIEVDPHSGTTKDSLLTRCIEEKGGTYAELLEELIALARKEKEIVPLKQA